MIKTSNETGYTLIEIVIALSIFSIISIIVANVLSHTLLTNQRINNASSKLDRLQLAHQILLQDFQETIPVAIRTTLAIHADFETVFSGTSDSVEFTRSGVITDQPLQHIAYLCQKDRLIKRTWQEVHSPDRNLYNDKTILKKINNCSFSYVKATTTQSYWQATPENPMPQAVYFNFGTMQQDNTTSWLFVVSAAIYRSIEVK